MCLVAFAYQAVEGTPLILTSNRDEMRDRPTLTAHFWSDLPSVYGGRDLRSDGTWLALSTDKPHRLACVTNVRTPQALDEMDSSAQTSLKSRGILVSDFVSTTLSCEAFLDHSSLDQYGPCNLILYDGSILWYATNRDAQMNRKTISYALSPGVYALSNAQLNTPWPKVIAARERLTEALNMESTDSLWGPISNPQTYPDEQLPNTGVPLEWERLLSAALILGEPYGTCSQAQVIISEHKTRFEERSLNIQGDVIHTHTQVFP